jgi:hypothetical protein
MLDVLLVLLMMLHLLLLELMAMVLLLMLLLLLLLLIPPGVHHWMFSHCRLSQTITCGLDGRDVSSRIGS